MTNTTKFFEAEYISDIEGAGGGGCFTKDQKVFTSHGWKPIHRIRPGDLVVAYDVEGTLGHGVVVQTFTHPIEQNNSGIYTIKWIEGEQTQSLEVTGNHAIYVGIETESQFKEAREFEVGDTFYKYDGTPLVITEIDFRDIEPDELTYNLEISPHHTYIVNGVKVHNGGGGKSSSGSSRPAQEEPNTLRSTNIARVMEVISEGPIFGLTTNSFQSIYFNDTVVQNTDGSYNFSVLQGDFRIGLPTQDYVKGFNGAESVQFINTEVTVANPVVRTVSANTDAALVQVRLPNGLMFQDATTGDLKGNSVQIKIQVRPTGGLWTDVMSPTISGKTTSPYDVAYRVTKPSTATSTWDVRVSRVTADSTKANDVKNTWFLQITEVDEVKLSYPDVAYAAVAVDAQSVGNSIPNRSYDVKGIICRVPSNYNTVTRAYSGVWNGTFKSDWTDNPAWVLYDLLTSTRYGMGEFIDESTIDKWSFYTAAQYNDQLVSDGNGGTEPRFTFNQPIVTREECWKLIQVIASTMRAVVIPGGIVTLVQDRPTQPVKIINNSSVKDGVFTYTSSGILSRHTVVNVTYNDKYDRYLPRTITEEDSDGIEKYGYNQSDLTAYGCVTEGQARRLGKWFLDTELNQTEMVSFETSFNQADVVPGDVISVVDNDYVGATYAGRVVSTLNATVTLDAAITLKAGAAYTFYFVEADGISIGSRTITNAAGTYTTLTLSSGVTGDVRGREWMATSPADVVARQFRVVSIRESEKGLFSISAVQYDPYKYDRVELGIQNPDLVYSLLPSQRTDPVTNIIGQIESFIDPVKGPQVNFRVSWTKPTTPYTAYYLVRYSRDKGPFSQVFSADNNDFIVENVVEGDYIFQVIAVNIRGIQSVPTVATLPAYYTGQLTQLFPPTALRTVQGYGSGSIWYSQNLYLTWTPSIYNSAVIGEVVGGYRVQLFDQDNVTLIREAVVGPAVTNYTYYYDDNKGDGELRRNIVVKVSTLNAVGIPTTPAVVLFTKPSPPPPDDFTITVPTMAAYNVKVHISNPSPDAVGIAIFQGTSPNFVPSTANIVYQGPNLEGGMNVPIMPGFLYYVRVGVYDSFGVQGIATTDAKPIVDPTIPIYVENIKVAYAGINTALLSWDPIADPSIQYQIYHSVTNTIADAQLMAVVSQSGYLTSGINTEIDNYFWIRVINGLGQTGPFHLGLSGKEFKRLRANLFVESEDAVSVKVDALRYRVHYTHNGTNYTYPSPSSYAVYGNIVTTYRNKGEMFWADAALARSEDSVSPLPGYPYAYVNSVRRSANLEFELNPTNLQPGWVAVPDIPDEADITGIEVRLKAASSKTNTDQVAIEFFDPDTSRFSDEGPMGIDYFNPFTSVDTWQIRTKGGSTNLWGFENGGYRLRGVPFIVPITALEKPKDVVTSSIKTVGTNDDSFAESYPVHSLSQMNQWERVVLSGNFMAEAVATYNINFNIGYNITGINVPEEPEGYPLPDVGLRFKIELYSVTKNRVWDTYTYTALEINHTVFGKPNFIFGDARLDSNGFMGSSAFYNVRMLWSTIGTGGDGILIPDHTYNVRVYANRYKFPTMVWGNPFTGWIWPKVTEARKVIYINE